MPRLIEPEGRTETLVDAINYVLARDGVAGLTLRTISRESRVSTSSMLHHFGTRERLLVVAVQVTAAARLRDFEKRARTEGVAAFLPAPGDEEDLITARAWLGWLEVWRSQDALTEPMSRMRDREILLLADVLGVRPASHDLTLVAALIDGLTVAVCCPVRPLAPERARRLLCAYVATDAELSLPPQT